MPTGRGVVAFVFVRGDAVAADEARDAYVLIAQVSLCRVRAVKVQRHLSGRLSRRYFLLALSRRMKKTGYLLGQGYFVSSQRLSVRRLFLRWRRRRRTATRGRLHGFCCCGLRGAGATSRFRLRR